MTGRGWALVTGAGKRIGRVLALTAAEAGHDVLVHHRNSAEDAEATAQLIRELGRKAETRSADLTAPDGVAHLIADAPGPVTLLVNNASHFEDDRLGNLEAANFDIMLSANLKAPILLSQAFASALGADHDGLIVNIIDQRVWRLTPQYFSYTISKSALWTATQTMAQALAPRIRVNAIGPVRHWPMSIRRQPISRRKRGRCHWGARSSPMRLARRFAI